MRLLVIVIVVALWNRRPTEVDEDNWIQET